MSSRNLVVTNLRGRPGRGLAMPEGRAEKKASDVMSALQLLGQKAEGGSYIEKVEDLLKKALRIDPMDDAYDVEGPKGSALGLTYTGIDRRRAGHYLRILLISAIDTGVLSKPSGKIQVAVDAPDNGDITIALSSGKKKQAKKK